MTKCWSHIYPTAHTKLIPLQFFRKLGGKASKGYETVSKIHQCQSKIKQTHPFQLYIDNSKHIPKIPHF